MKRTKNKRDWKRAGFAFALAAASSPALGQVLSADEIDSETSRAMNTLRPAGMAVAVVQDGKIMFVKGYGVRRYGSPDQVDPDTVFPLASVSKAFTATALAVLVEERKLGWDEPVRRYLPDFEMSDPYVTEHLTVRDLLVHRSGLALGAGDLLRWPDGDASDEDMLNALRHLPLETGFRDRFVYDNILYSVAGELITRVSGQHWTDFFAARLFKPLGLTSCTADPDRTRPDNRAIEHARAAGGDTGRPLDELSTRADPGGSVACSVTDVARWAAFQLSDGTAARGQRVLSPESMRTLHRGIVPVPPFGAPKRLGYTNVSQYALGWFVSDFAGTLLVDHSGAGPGAATNVGLLPEKNAAVVVLVNDMAPAPVIANHLLARLVQGDGATDWIGDVAARRASRRIARQAEEEPVLAEAAPNRPLSDYAGTYRDPWYGDITVAEREGGLAIHLTRSKLLKGPLVPLGGDRFLARWPNRDLGADATVTFESDGTERVQRISLAPASDRIDFSYDYQHLAPVRVP